MYFVKIFNTTECTQSAHRVHTECTQSAHRVHTECTQSAHRVHTECSSSKLSKNLAEYYQTQQGKDVTDDGVLSFFGFFFFLFLFFFLVLFILLMITTKYFNYEYCQCPGIMDMVLE